VLSSVDREWFQAHVSKKMPRHWIVGFIIIITLVFAAIWIGQVFTTISTGIVDSGHLIFVIDLMIVLPAFGITAVKLFRNDPMGDVLAGMLLIKFISLCVSITVGQWFRSLAGISIETGLLGVFIPLGLVAITLTALYFRHIINSNESLITQAGNTK